MMRLKRVNEIRNQPMRLEILLARLSLVECVLVEGRS